MSEESFIDLIKPKTAKEALERWDSGGNLFTIEMGGLGPGYEQAIHILVFEIIRDYLGKELPPAGTPMGDWANATVDRVNAECGGFSGAQVGAAKNLAYHFLQNGYLATLDKQPKRLIQVSNFFPKTA